MIKYGKKVSIITICEVLGAVILVFVIMYFLFQQSFAFSIVIASMSAATAPAATLLVIRQYRAHGPLTKTVLPVVALDDVFGIMIFGIAITLAKMSTNNSDFSVVRLIIKPLREILGSILIGFLIGIVLSLITKRLKKMMTFKLLRF